MLKTLKSEATEIRYSIKADTELKGDYAEDLIKYKNKILRMEEAGDLSEKQANQLLKAVGL